MQMKEVQETRTHHDRTAEGGSQQRENHWKQGMNNQPLQVSTSQEDVREDDPAGPCGSCHHARGIGTGPVRKP